MPARLSNKRIYIGVTIVLIFSDYHAEAKAYEVAITSFDWLYEPTSQDA